MARSDSLYDKTSAGQALTALQAAVGTGDRLKVELGTIRDNAQVEEAKPLPEVIVKTARRAIAYTAPESERVQFSKDAGTLAIVGCDVWKDDVIVRYHPTEHRREGRGDRTEISEFSKSSRDELRHTVVNSETIALGMITLTYPNRHPVDGRVSKSQLDNFFREVRRAYPGQLEYLWFMEFQRRGAPHYHVLTAGSIHHDLQKVTMHLEKCDGKSCGVTEEKPWGHIGYQPSEGKRRAPHCRLVYKGAPESVVVRSWLRAIGAEHDDNAVRFNHGGIWEPWHNADGYAKYVAKETHKMWQKAVPAFFRNCGRFWATSQGWHKPKCLHTFTGTSQDVRRYLGIADDAPLFPTLYGISKTIKQPTLV